MAGKGQKGESGTETPKDYPSVTPPQDLYAMSDIRFVMMEIGKLTNSVERLIKDVDSVGERLSSIEIKTAQVRGGIFVFLVLMPVMATLFWWLVGDKIQTLRDDIMNRPPVVQAQPQQP